MPDPALPLHGPSVDAFVQFAESTPLGLRGAVALTGGLLLVAGARLYRLAIVAPGIVGGVLLASWAPLSPDPLIQALAYVVLAGVGGLACHFLERLAIHAIGALVVAACANAAWPLVTGDPTPWWAPAGGALVGLFLFPPVFRSLVHWVTALLGAAIVAWAAGWSGSLPIILGLALVGGGIQYATRSGRRRSRARED